ncbi:hypothetical protein A2334_00705 [Candidatus Roizmanbacteria bacterium RIFOXYB2_FULL_38_10]|uniref:Glycosyltransferase 2-like domain-containing protein n=1 Tax=Candidatus Roizmanbacteria bacterium RIFOXYD1_FULL_38_12 TaxID=1802093 RepID=A0A1F7L1B6_9BACT|nr:MAG: hypothetical protein A3K47_03975 [Candidatus Roizmanbacteria bacterium RIFOXYA2_FULL_38_14]OGK63915.1 MAG: hypothetical protein A3K27_03975 [Candidatus Roizmanbacteria bacterium RIFOXYA1_FULL_37_12]OGK65761.1 MAG: hypothetical protein A3K38_03975 [Candidatus Roizmanbacteria bacterium RIFOXYB1_FULL_40_23]OGK68205.1 MAG: hypothetical protein A2334_00705 [Candidatus Roizmanbacteria bacterium RIFOXYB2_FULL_38_10]OGK70166.1 MAG: hypothetical protein A3K21_03980 [Candidatus Roizmanbacteria ba
MKNQTQKNNSSVAKAMEDKPLVSVIIPVFNGSPFLEETITSVFNSTYKNIEVLLIDDGSTDKSKELCHRLEKRYKKVRFYSFPKNKGLGRVLNFALRQAHGELICRINQDDRMLRYRIQTQVDFMDKNPEIVAVGSSIKLFENNGKKQIVHFLQRDQEIKKMWHIVSPFADPSVMYRKSVARKVGGYKQEFWPGDDTHLWVRMGTRGKLANIDKPLVEVRYHSKAASVRYFKKLTVVTYKLHRWMHNHVQKAALPVQLFWIGQLIAGLLLPPDMNWNIYRILKRVIYFAAGVAHFLRNLKVKNTIVAKVIPHPMALNRSGQ